MRLVGLVSLLGCVLLLTGCGAESPRQAGARVAVERLAARPRATTSSGPAAPTTRRPWFIERETTVYVCAAKRRDGGCDWYRATLKNAGWDVVLDERNAGCVLPF